MAEFEQVGDRLVLYLDPGGPIDLVELTDSFAALARMYARHYRPAGEVETAPKLHVTKLESGSVWAEIAPLLPIMGQAYSSVAVAVTVGDFANRIAHGLQAFIDPGSAAAPAAIGRDDAADLREFVKPLTGRAKAKLNVTHARYAHRDGERETVVEYKFDEGEINRAALAIDRALEAPVEKAAATTKLLNEVLLYFDVASRSAGKEKGRTHDRAIVPEVTDRALTTYFRKGVSGDPKAMILSDDANPIANNGYIVDVMVQVIDDEPKLYIVTHVHDTVPLDV